MPALVEFNVELSVESLNTSLKSNAMPAVGYSILDVTNSMNEMKDSFTYIPVSVSPKSVKGRVIAEQLADSPVEENAFLKVEFPDEEIMDVEEDTPNTRWTMYFDGAVNNQGQGIGAVLVSPQKEYIPISIKLQTKNHFADALATLASMLDISATMEVQPLTVRLQWEPAHVNVIEIAARCPDGKPWYTDIGNLISGEGHPPEASGKERRTLQKLAANFVICGDQLYRRSFDGIQLLCVDEDKAVELIEQTHEGNSSSEGKKGGNGSLSGFWDLPHRSL
ncbi:uncharacterized protein LOC143858457 [Tasmannia lanceolata]|uniref:uncharacterized protein LOC143858457 n=1 Tax=Tasmannia lanceolata TaxID=3420 RepID=UPI0040630256